MEDFPDTLRVCFVPARNGSGVICRLPLAEATYSADKVALPSRLYWNQPPPRPYELWLVRPCSEIARPAFPGVACPAFPGAPTVCYVKSIRRLAEAPFRDTRTGRWGNCALWRLGRFLAMLVGGRLRSRPER